MTNTSALSPPSAGTLDTGALARFLSPRLPGQWAQPTLERFVGGQSNPTYRLQAGAQAYVLRKKPDGVLLPSAHAIDREYRVMKALAVCGLPVPDPALYVEDPSIIGTPFYVMPFVEGRIFKDPALPGLSSNERHAIYQAMAAALAALHRVDPQRALLADFGRPVDFYKRQIKRWSEQYRAVAVEPLADMETLMAWLAANIPVGEESVVAHGDFRLENLIFHPTEPRLLAILDWELSTLGDPKADLAYNMMAWYLPERAFGGFTDRDITGSGIPSEAQYLQSYCLAAGRAGVANWNFYVAFAMFRLASILFGVLRRGLDGNASSPDAVARGRLAVVCAQSAVQAMQRHQRGENSQT